MKRFLQLLFISATFISQSAFAGGGVPANDLCSGAEPITCGQTITSSTTDATSDGGLSFCGTDLTTAPGVWYSFTGDGSDVTLSLCGSGFDTKIGVFTGSCGALVCVSGNDDFCALHSETGPFTAVNGTDYYVYVTGFGSASGIFGLTMTCVTPPESACGGSLVSCGDVINGTTVGEPSRAEPGSCGAEGGDLTTAAGVWHKFVGTGADVTFSLCGSTFDTKIGVFSGDCDALVCVDSDDDECGLQSEITVSSTIGDTLYVYVTGFGSNEGAYTLTVTCDPEVLCQDVTVQLDGNGDYSFATPLTPQTDAEVAIGGGATGGASFWQSFVPMVDGILDQITTTFSTLPGGDVDLNVYDGQGVGGTLLYTQSFTPSTAGSPSVVDLLTTLDVLSGTEYTFELMPLAPFQIQTTAGDPYPAGVSSVGGPTDLRFSVDILQRPLVDNGTTDSDGIDHWTLSQSAFDCSHVGANPITFTAVDKLGNSIACFPTVNVEDDEDPVAVCVSTIPGVSVTNNYADAPNLGIPDNDPAGISTVINVPDDLTITDINVNLNVEHTWVGDLTLTLTSPGGGSVAVLVDEIGDPAIGTLGCSEDNFNVTLDDGAGSALEDECSTPITGTFTGTDLLSIFNGASSMGDWTLFASDAAGGDTGIILDWSMDITGTTPPSFVEFALDGSGNYTVNPLNDIDDGSSDNCSVTLTTNPSSFDCADVGVQSITLTATDPAGNTNSCVTQVEIVDNTPPTAVCQNITVYLDGTGAASIVPADIDNGSDDNCSVSTLSVDILDFNCSNTGANAVTLTVEDVNGLTSTCGAVVTVEDTIRPVIACQANIVVCSDDNSGAIVSYPALVADDNCPFTLNQSDVTGLTSGDVFPIGVTTQEWTATDATGNTRVCTFTITVNATPIADYSFTAACQNEAIFFSDESTIVSGYSIDSWSWDMDDGSSAIGLVDPIHQYADTGMYNVELVVMTPEGCSDTSTQVVHVTPVPTASFTFVEACEGTPTDFTNTSTIDAGNLNYAWDFGDGNSSADENPSHSFTDDGTYTVTLTVTSDDGCEDVTSASVNVFAAPSALFVATTECEGLATSFTNLSTGSGLSYSWDFGDSSPASLDESPTYTYAAAGPYTVTLTVTNSNSCVSIYTETVTVNPLPNVNFTLTDICEDVEATFTNTSDAGTYAWDFGDGSSSTLESVSHAYNPFGTYNVTLTVTDANFCINSLTQPIEIFDLPDFTLAPTDVLCYGEATGMIEVVPAGTPAAPWSMSLNGGTPQSVSVFFNDLEAGDYDVTVEDDNGCFFNVETVVGQPSDTLGIDLNSIVDILCHGDNSGEIDIEGAGGTGPYMYSIDAGTAGSSGVFSGLEAGTHDIQIVDFNLCVFDTTITLTEPDTLVLTLVESNDLLCNGDNSGSLTVMGTGGVLDYEYNLDGGAYDASNLFDGLAAGTYIVGVVDANGCTDTLHVTLDEPGILQLSLLGSGDAQCFGEASGFINVEAASGTPDYQYSLDGVSFQGSGLFQGLTAGTYNVVVMDANGCLDDLDVELLEPTELVIETNSVPVACFGDATGEIIITATGGTADYQYSIDGGSTFELSGDFTDLENGEYLIVVEDDNGCTASEGVVISEPTASFELDVVVTDVGCIGESTGSVLLVGSGGTPTYTYSDDNIAFVTPNEFDGYPVGTYSFYGQDLNGCVDSLEVTMNEPATAVPLPLLPHL